MRTNNELNPHMTPSPGIEPGPHNSFNALRVHALKTRKAVCNNNGEHHEGISLYKNCVYLSYDPYGPASAFFAKPLMKVLYRAVRICARGAEKNSTALLQKCTVSRVKNLSPNWSYDKILID